MEQVSPLCNDFLGKQVVPVVRKKSIKLTVTTVIHVVASEGQDQSDEQDYGNGSSHNYILNTILVNNGSRQPHGPLLSATRRHAADLIDFFYGLIYLNRYITGISYLHMVFGDSWL